jgi:hypothetical protein
MQMRRFSFNEFWINSDGTHEDFVVTMTEEAIKKEYWPYWYDRMCQKFGKEGVDSVFTFEHCIEDWMSLHWAWEVKDESTAS